MLAVHVSLLCLNRTGSIKLQAHARDEARWFREQASMCSRDEMLTHRLKDLDNVYGRAFVVGEELMIALGWGQMKRLGCCFGSDGQPHARRWFAQLTPDEQARARVVRGQPTRKWV
jgi:hypothetical protein